MNIVLVISDDQRADTIADMSNVQRLAQRGVKFTQAHVVSPVCCPSRCSILRGAYPHTTEVYGNHGQYGGFGSFNDETTIATALSAAGYKTGLFGKYLNGYGEEPGSSTYIPPGWDTWACITSDGKFYYNYSLNVDGAVVSYADQPEDYLTDVLFSKAQAFIAEAINEGRPFFTYLTPVAPHNNAVPETAYETVYDKIAPWRPPSYNEADVSTKPAWMQKTQLLDRRFAKELDDTRERQLETLLSVDDGVGAILDQLEHAGQLENTLFIYTSDNGYFWGEHRLDGKNRPYEEATHIPMVASLPGGIVAESPDLAASIDLAPTAADVAGVSLLGAEGVSLLPFLRGDVGNIRSEHLIESMGVRSVPAWVQLRSKRWSFTHYATGEEELYNMVEDPFQLNNVAAAGVPDRVRNALRDLAQPLPPGFPAF